MSLRFIHRRIRRSHQIFRGDESATQLGHADACSGGHSVVCCDPGLVRDRFDESIRDLRSGNAVGPSQQSSEFIATETSCRVALSQPLDQGSARRLENPVADCVAQGVVDRLEVVEVDHEQ